MKEILVKKLCKTLEDKYMSKIPLNHLFLKKELYNLTYTPGTPLNDHVNSFNKLWANFCNLDEQFGDEYKTLML